MPQTRFLLRKDMNLVAVVVVEVVGVQKDNAGVVNKNRQKSSHNILPTVCLPVFVGVIRSVKVRWLKFIEEFNSIRWNSRRNVSRKPYGGQASAFYVYDEEFIELLRAIQDSTVPKRARIRAAVTNPAILQKVCEAIRNCLSHNSSLQCLHLGWTVTCGDSTTGGSLECLCGWPLAKLYYRHKRTLS